MWIVILNFCLFLLLLGFFFYGIRQWTGLIAEHEDQENGKRVVDGNFYRLPVWILLTGIGIITLTSDLMRWLGY